MCCARRCFLKLVAHPCMGALSHPECGRQHRRAGACHYRHKAAAFRKCWMYQQCCWTVANPSSLTKHAGSCSTMPSCLCCGVCLLHLCCLLSVGRLVVSSAAAARDCGSHATAAACCWWCSAFMRMHPSACAGRALGLLAALLLRVGCCVRLTASIRAWAGRRKVVLGK